MVKYICLRCGYSNNNKTVFIKHLKRKFKCQVTCEDIDADILYDLYFNSQCAQKLLKNYSEILNKYSEILPNYSEMIKNTEERNNCNFCNKPFTRKFNLKRHEASCKEKYENKIIDEIDKVKELTVMLREKELEIKKMEKEKKLELREKDKYGEIELKEKEKEKNQLIKEKAKERKTLIKRREKLLKEQEKSYELVLKKEVGILVKELQKKDKQIEELIKSNGNSINIDNSKNLNVNIKINPFEKTDYSHITDRDYLECIKHANMCIPFFIEKLHFDPEKPENHNVLIKNLKVGYIMTNNGRKWVYRSCDETVSFLIEDNANIIEDKIAYWSESGHKYARQEKYIKILDKFSRFLERRSDSKYVEKMVEKEVKLVLFNNRDMIMDKQKV